MNKIYKIKRHDSIGWDEVIGFMVVAENKEKAIELTKKEGWGDYSFNMEDIDIEEVGISHNLSPAILLESFNAG